MTAMTAAGVLVGVNTLLLFLLSLFVVARRVSARVDLGTGGDQQLELRIRAHANAVEYIPATMLCLFVYASMGGSGLAVLVVGGLFTLGRVLHAIGLVGTVRPARASGMILTWLGMLGAGGGLVWQAVMAG